MVLLFLISNLILMKGIDLDVVQTPHVVQPLQDSAEIVHIDYNVCFDKGTKLRVPEIVPFR